MARRKDGRELFEVFRETMASPAPPVQPKAPSSEPSQPAAGYYDEAIHTIRLGDRRQVEVFLSNGWVYGLIIFVLLLLAGAFILGTRFAPEAPAAPQVSASDALVSEAENVGSVSRINSPITLSEPQPPETFQPPAAGSSLPAPVTGRANYALRVTTIAIRYSGSAEHKASAEAVVRFLQSQGVGDARMLVEKSRGSLVVVAGSFDTQSEEAARALKARVTAMRFGRDDFKDAYFVRLADYK